MRPYKIFGVSMCFAVGVLAWTVLGGRERVLLSGNFHSVAHKGSGEARVVMTRGQRFLRLLDIRTYPASDLQVCLVAAPDAEDNDTVKQAGFACLGGYNPKDAFVAYAVPAGVDLERYRSVTVWSRSYEVNFTTAPLAER